MFIEKILLSKTCPIYTLYGVFDLLSANYISDSISISKFFSFHKKMEFAWNEFYRVAIDRLIVWS